jgi:hypothetical protein
MFRYAHKWVSLSLALGLLVASLTVTFAHPLGNFTVNRYSRLELSADQIRVRYIVDMAEIPAFQEQQRMDLNADGTVDDAEREQYLSTEIAALSGKIYLNLNDAAIALQPSDYTLEFPPASGWRRSCRKQRRRQRRRGKWLIATITSRAGWAGRK